MTDLAAWIASKRAASAGATEGPWRWEVNLKSHTVWLSGGKRPYDVEVMRFERWGMSSAAPAFLDNPSNPRAIVRADKLVAVVPGREHHAAWFQTIDHPDARHIAAFDPATTRRLIDAAEVLAAFVEKVEAGKARSTDTYNRAKAALDALRGGGE